MNSERCIFEMTRELSSRTYEKQKHCQSNTYHRTQSGFTGRISYQDRGSTIYLALEKVTWHSVDLQDGLLQI